MDKLIYACHEELDEIWQLFVDAKNMETQGICQWTSSYPDKDIVKTDICKLLIHKMNQEKSLVQEPLVQNFGARRESWV